jgi:CBS domain-containing protein
MICPTCGHDNLPGSEHCANCLHDLTALDRPIAIDRVDRSLMEDPVGILRPRTPIALAPTATLREAIALMLASDIGAVLVVDADGQLLGILSERDLLTKVAGVVPDYADRPVSEFMTPTPEVVQPQDCLAFALHKMDTGGYRHLPVVREGKPVGMVSVRDMLRHITRICGNRG